MKNLFSDPCKFRQIYKDPTPKRLTPLLRYLKQLDEREELPDAIYNNIGPKHAHLASALGLFLNWAKILIIFIFPFYY